MNDRHCVEELVMQDELRIGYFKYLFQRVRDTNKCGTKFTRLLSCFHLNPLLDLLAEKTGRKHEQNILKIALHDYWLSYGRRRKDKARKRVI